jgi:hypothetical protein
MNSQNQQRHSIPKENAPVTKLTSANKPNSTFIKTFNKLNSFYSSDTYKGTTKAHNLLYTKA